jgi:hypothetical protein
MFTGMSLCIMLIIPTSLLLVSYADHIPVLFKMAPHTVPNLPSQTTSALPILLVTELPRHPPHYPPDIA